MSRTQTPFQKIDLKDPLQEIELRYQKVFEQAREVRNRELMRRLKQMKKEEIDRVKRRR